MKQFIEKGDVDRINQILKKTNFITKRNMDKFINYATTVLTNYKNQTLDLLRK